MTASARAENKTLATHLPIEPGRQNQTIVIYGPRRFDRTGILTKATEQFNVPADALPPYNILVQNGETDGSGRVLIGTVRLNS